MYSDLSVTRVAVSDAKILKHNDVLAVSISHQKQPGTGLRKKWYQLVYEYDYYTVVWDNEGCFLGGYNDDMYWFNYETPWKKYGEGFTNSFPYLMPEKSMTLEGVFVDKDVYAKAKKIFTDVNGIMS